MNESGLGREQIESRSPVMGSAWVEGSSPRPDGKTCAVSTGGHGIPQFLGNCLDNGIAETTALQITAQSL
jgi:hypothetical protein